MLEPASPNWTDSFDYAPGPLVPNDNWTVDPFDADTGTIGPSGTWKVTSGGPDSGARNDRTSSGLDVQSPWHLSMRITFVPGADTGAFFQFAFVGTDVIGLRFTMAAGDGAADRIGVVQLNAADGGSPSAANVPFTANTEHLVEVTWDGTDFAILIDSVLIVSATPTAFDTSPIVLIYGTAAGAASTWAVTEVSTSQP